MLQPLQGVLGDIRYLKPPNPDVSKPDGIAMILEVEGRFGNDTLKRRGGRRFTVHGNVILNKHSVMQYGERTRLNLAVRQ